jgi:hypothetical protein
MVTRFLKYDKQEQDYSPAGENMKALTPAEMVMLYKFTKSSMIAGGVFLIGYGAWWLLGPFLLGTASDPLWLFGIFPLYVGAMFILIALAMKEDWFTNARRYW